MAIVGTLLVGPNPTLKSVNAVAVDPSAAQREETNVALPSGGDQPGVSTLKYQHNKRCCSPVRTAACDHQQASGAHSPSLFFGGLPNFGRGGI